MRNSALVASAMLALSLVPAAATAQGPHWIFEVPVDFKTLNQEVDHLKVRCYAYKDPFEHATDPVIGEGESDEIHPNAQGNISGVTTVAANALPGKNPGQARHYRCTYRLFRADGTSGNCGGSLHNVVFMKKPGTVCVYLVKGAIFP